MLWQYGHGEKMSKTCIKCSKEKEVSLFLKNRNICKECFKIYSKNRYIENKEKILKKQHEYWKRKMSITENRIRENNRLSEYKKTESGKEKRKESQDKYAHSEKRRMYIRGWESNKRKNNLEYHLHQIISHQISSRIKSKKNNRSIFNFVSFTIEDLKEHLEKQFVDGMTWDNYGEWHIDHIIPVSVFNLNDENNIKKCWSIRNLRPLWKKDNIIKKDKIILEEIEKYQIIDLLPKEK